MARVTSKARASSHDGSLGTSPDALRSHFRPDRSPRVVSCVIGGREGARPAGVALSRIGETDRFGLAVVDAAGNSLLPLGPFPEEDVVALWRGLGASSGLALLIETADGSREAAYEQIGPVQLGAIRIRRRHGLLNGRRPRFLVRRKTGRVPVRPQVFREREMFEGR